MNKDEALKRLTPILLTSLVLCLITVHVPPASGAESDKTVELVSGNHYVLQLVNFNEGDEMKIIVDVESGSSVDVLIMDSINYAYYENDGEFEYDHYNSDLRTMGATFTYTYPDDDHHYYLVVDNTATPANGATPTGTAIVHVQLEQTHNEPQDTSGSSSNTICTGIFVAAVIIGIFWFVTRE